MTETDSRRGVYLSKRTGGGETKIYERGNDNAWITSNVSVRLAWYT
ncbi:hypothetical protein [Halegenticoccus soli]|nr:hypothetical protein [Halegenticoccus soli]